MAFTVEDYQDLVQLLMENPQWRIELRQLLLGDDFLALPAIVRDLAEAQLRTEERLEALAQRVEELAEAQKRAVTSIQALTTRLNALDGRVFELMYRDKATAYFGGLLRRLRVVQPNALEDVLEARLTQKEMLNVFRLDLLLNGRLRQAPPDLADREVWLAVEVSLTIEDEDVERACERAKYLQKAGYCAIPVVAGRDIYMSADNLARSSSVAMLLDGRAYLWEEALETWVRSDRGPEQPA